MFNWILCKFINSMKNTKTSKKFILHNNFSNLWVSKKWYEMYFLKVKILNFEFFIQIFLFLRKCLKKMPIVLNFPFSDEQRDQYYLWIFSKQDSKSFDLFHFISLLFCWRKSIKSKNGKTLTIEFNDTITKSIWGIVEKEALKVSNSFSVILKYLFFW